MVEELWSRPESGPFQYPVDTKEVPIYKKIIKKPMDLNQIRMNIENNKLVSSLSVAFAESQNGFFKEWFFFGSIFGFEFWNIGINNMFFLRWLILREDRIWGILISNSESSGLGSFGTPEIEETSLELERLIFVNGGLEYSGGYLDFRAAVEKNFKNFLRNVKRNF